MRFLSQYKDVILIFLILASLVGVTIVYIVMHVLS
jgi:hypothetical protein